MQIILDISGGNTHKNDWAYAKRMIDEVAAVDNHKHEIILKPQLFVKAGDNIPLKAIIFDKMFHYSKKLGYKMTASVFDEISLAFLLLYEPCFIKIANRRDLDWLIGEIPRKIPVYKSVSPEEYWGGGIGDAGLRWAFEHTIHLLCVSKYPATATDYLKDKPASLSNLKPYGLSDHTIGIDFVKEQEPQAYECHFALEDSTGLDAGPWAKRPKELKEVLEL